MKKFICFAVLFTVIVSAGDSPGLERGAILYHTSKGDNIYGRTDDLTLPCSIGEIALREMKSGHVGLYIGDGRIIHAVMPAVEETDSRNFIPQDDLDERCRYLGAKVPANFHDHLAWPEERKDQLILLAKLQVGARYDALFTHQKGPYEDGFTCVGLVEYVYEDPSVDYDITPSGYYPDDGVGRKYTQRYNCDVWQDWPGENTFAETVEFSKFEHPLAKMLGIGREYHGDMYMFFPYTQYLQTSTVAVETDVPVSGGTGEDSHDTGRCFIATAAYGSPLHPQVMLLREVRDRYLLSNRPGRLFVDAYYRFSPPAARFIGDHETLKAATRICLLPFFALSYSILNLGLNFTLIILIILLALPVYFVSFHRAKVRRHREQA